MNEKLLNKLVEWFKYDSVRFKDLTDAEFEILFKEIDILRTVMVFERSIRENHR